MSEAEVLTAGSPMEAAEIAELLSLIAGTEVTVTDGGFRVKETSTHWVDVIRTIFNWRVARTEKSCDWSYDRYWCYAGTGFGTLVRAVRAAVEWDGGDRTDPVGWNKNGQTGEWRAPGEESVS